MFYHIYFLSLFSLIFFLFRHFRILVPGDCNFKFTVLYNNIYTRFTVSILEIKVFMKKILKLSHFFNKKKKRQILNLSQYFCSYKKFQNANISYFQNSKWCYNFKCPKQILEKLLQKIIFGGFWKCHSIFGYFWNWSTQKTFLNQIYNYIKLWVLFTTHTQKRNFIHIMWSVLSNGSSPNLVSNIKIISVN